VLVGIIRQKPVLTHASIVCEGMLASVNSVNLVNSVDSIMSFAHAAGFAAARRCLLFTARAMLRHTPVLCQNLAPSDLPTPKGSEF